MKIVDYIFLNKKNSLKTALVCEKKTISYKDLYENSKKLSENLLKCIGKEKTNILLCMDNNIEFVHVIIALNKLDMTSIPINRNSIFSEIKTKYSLFDCSLIIFDSTTFKLYENELSEVNYCIISSENTIDKISMCRSIQVQKNNGVAFIFSTSGSVGDSKGVMLTNDNVIENIKSIIDYSEITCRDKLLLVKKFCHVSSVNSELLLGLAAGAEIHIFRSFVLPRRIIEYIVSNAITVYFTVPPLLLELFDTSYSKVLNNCKLRIIHFYGAPMIFDRVSKIIKDYMNINFIYSYGLTEASPRVTYCTGKEILANPGTSGKAIKGVEILCGDSLENLGEIRVRGKNVMLGYYQNPFITNEVIKNGWLSTGDYGYMKNNYLYVLGRKDNRITYYGKNFFLEEIESEILKCSSVKETMVELQSNSNGERIVAYLVANKGLEKNVIDDVNSHLVSNIELFKIPNQYCVVDEIMKTENGKVKRNGKRKCDQ